MPSHEVVNNGSYSCCRRERCVVLKWILAAVNALAQSSGLTDCSERRPVWPRPDCVPVFATANPVVQYEGPGAFRCYTDAKSPRSLRALDYGASKIGDPVPSRRDRQPLDRLFAQIRLG